METLGARERVESSFSDESSRVERGSPDYIFMENFLIDQNTSRNHLRHSREPRSSRLVHSEPILSSRSHFSKIRSNDAIEIFRLTKNQLSMVAPILAPILQRELLIKITLAILLE